MDKFNLVVRAARELARAVQENYYDLSDLNIINYSEVCDWCNFPDLQDGGIYERDLLYFLLARLTPYFFA